MSSGAYLTSVVVNQGSSGVPVYAFVTKLSADLKTVIYSTYYGSGRTNTIYAPTTTGRSIIVDSRGAATIGGSTTVNAPLMGGSSGSGNPPEPYPFVARFAPDGTTLEASSNFNNSTAVRGVVALALDGSGNTWAVGDANMLAKVTVGGRLPLPGGSGYIAKLDKNFNVVFGTLLGDVGSPSGIPISGLELDPSGNVWISGISHVGYLPGGSSDSPGTRTPYIAELSSDGSFLKLFLTPIGGVAMAQGAGGSLVVLGTPDSFLLSDSTAHAGPFIVTSSANSVSSGTVAPGELVSLFGEGIGPSTPMSGIVSDGVFVNNLGGYQVFFNDIPAPLFYAGPYQINTVVPEALTSLTSAGTTLPTATLKVVGPNGKIDLPSVFVTASQPRVFSTGTGTTFGTTFYATALNEDGSVNSASNPALGGSIVTIWATGLGYEDAVDGSIVHQPVSRTPISVLCSATQSLDVLYGSDAPETVLGVTQVNFRLPATPCTAVAIRTATATSQYVSLWTKAQ